MNAVRRLWLIRVIEKIEKNPEFSKKIGVRNESTYYVVRKNQEEEKC